MIFAVVIFAIALAATASERVDRMKVALLGAALVVVSQAIDQEEAIEPVDFNTLVLLAGVILVRLDTPSDPRLAFASHSGACHRAHARGRRRRNT